MREQYGTWNWLAFQDLLLQGLKRLQRFYLEPKYHLLEKERKAFESRAGHRYAEQIHLTDHSTILIFKPDDIGDAVFALPAIKAIREKYPKCLLSLLCQKKTLPLYERTGLFDQIVAVDVRVRWLRFQSFDLRRALSEFKCKNFDVAIFLRTYPHFFKTFLQVPALFHVHPKDPRMKSRSQFQAYVSLCSEKRQHQALQMMQIAARLTTDKYEMADAQFPKFQFTSSDKEALSKTFPTVKENRYVVVHPFVKFETRRYPYGYWKEIIQWIQIEHGYQVVIVGANEDPPLSIPGTIEMQGKLDLGQTGYLISSAAAFLGVESGPAHWAAALGRPTIVLMGGHSLLSEWGPLGKTQVLQKSLPCFGCHRRACPDLKVKCLTQMSPEWVKPQIAEFLAKFHSQSRTNRPD